VNRNEIILMAKEAGFNLFYYSDKDPLLFETLGDEIAFERFAALVAAAEREACARVCEEHKALRLAEMIRARGEQ